MTPFTHTRRRSGFSLIELLIVVAIVVMLISLILPSFGKARELARQTICLANLRQIGSGFKAYANDNKNQYPILIDTGYPTNSWQSFVGYNDSWLEKGIADYTNVASDWSKRTTGGKIWLCPSSPIRLGLDNNGNRNYQNSTGAGYDPGLNNYKGLYYDFSEGVANRLSDPTWANYVNTWKSDFFTRPEGMPIQWCSVRLSSAEWNTLAARSWHGALCRPTVFMDGHAKKLVTSIYAGDNQDILFGKSSAHLLIWPSAASTNWSNGGNYCLSEY